MRADVGPVVGRETFHETQEELGDFVHCPRQDGATRPPECAQLGAEGQSGIEHVVSTLVPFKLAHVFLTVDLSGNLCSGQHVLVLLSHKPKVLLDVHHPQLFQCGLDAVARR